MRPDGGAVGQGAQKLLLDVLSGLQKEAGKVLIVTAFGAIVPWLDRLPVKRRTIILGALALVASTAGSLLNDGGGVTRVGGVAVISAVVLVAVMFGEHLRPRPPPPVPEVPPLPAWRAGLAWAAALPTSAVALGVPVWLAVGSATQRRRGLAHREEETRRELSATRHELSALQRELRRALEVLRGPPTGGLSDGSSGEGGSGDIRPASGAREAPVESAPRPAAPAREES